MLLVFLMILSDLVSPPLFALTTYLLLRLYLGFCAVSLVLRSLFSTFTFFSYTCPLCKFLVDPLLTPLTSFSLTPLRGSGPREFIFNAAHLAYKAFPVNGVKKKLAWAPWPGPRARCEFFLTPFTLQNHHFGCFPCGSQHLFGMTAGQGVGCGCGGGESLHDMSTT